VIDNRVAPHHHDGPDTEIEAAYLAAPRTGAHCRLILLALYICAAYGATDWELDEHTGITPHTSCGAMRNRLMQDGYVVDSGRRRLSKFGRKNIVWILTPKGVRYAEEQQAAS
jgi:hypothetical protein